MVKGILKSIQQSGEDNLAQYAPTNGMPGKPIILNWVIRSNQCGTLFAGVENILDTQLQKYLHQGCLWKKYLCWSAL